MNSSLEALRASLARALAEAKFDLGRATFYRHGVQTSYAIRPGEVVGPERLREMLAGAPPGDLDAERARSAHVHIADRLEADLRSSVRRALGPHCDPSSDCVGHAFPMGSTGLYTHAWPSGIKTETGVSSLDQFGAGMIKLAAVLGVNAVVDLLSAWTREGQLTYRTCVVVSVTLDEPIQPAAGIRITPLPLTTAELPAGLPISMNRRRSAFLGHSVLAIDTVSKPALFRPESSDDRNPVRGEWADNFDIDFICKALSLECDLCVNTGLSWNDYGDLNSVIANKSTSGSLASLGSPAERTTRNLLTGVSTIKLREGTVQSPSGDAINLVLKQLTTADVRTRLAVDRWKQSMRRDTTLTDRFIDLRIALESLFLPQTPDQQLKFRLAANGAWLVGSGGADRRRAWHILRHAYDMASRAVHRGEVKRGSEELLAKAQMICRAGIRRVLRDGPVSDWDGLILEAPCENPA